MTGELLAFLLFVLLLLLWVGWLLMRARRHVNEFLADDDDHDWERDPP